MKKNRILNVLMFINLVLIICQLQAQNERSLFFLPDIPQRKLVNPAAFPDHRLYVGVPILSSLKMGFENTLCYNDFFIRKGDSIYFEQDYFVNNLKLNNNINFDLSLEFLSAGIKIKDNYFNFRIADKMNVNTAITKETFQFFLYGNGHSAFLGKDIDLGGNGLNFSYVREYLLGFSKMINLQLSMGMNVKYLNGIANITSNNFSFLLFTDPVDYTIKMKSNVMVNTSLPNKSDFFDIFFNSENRGFAFDVGAEYKYNEKLSATLSAVNVGFVRWKSNLKNYETLDTTEEFVHEGFPLEDYFDSKTLASSALSKALDSIFYEIGIPTNKKEYRTSLPSWVNINVNYQPKPSHHVGLLYQSRFIKNQNWNTFTLAYTYSLKDKLHLMFSNTFSKSTLFSPSAAIGANLGAFQIYLISENFVAPFTFGNAKFYSLQLAINLVFKDEKILDQP
jgi:hypothetical protein